MPVESLSSILFLYPQCLYSFPPVHTISLSSMPVWFPLSILFLYPQCLYSPCRPYYFSNPNACTIFVVHTISQSSMPLWFPLSKRVLNPQCLYILCCPYYFSIPNACTVFLDHTILPLSVFSPFRIWTYVLLILKLPVCQLPASQNPNTT